MNQKELMVSNYESGASIPPGNILKICLEIVNNESAQVLKKRNINTDVEELIESIKKQASDPKQAKVRQAIRLLLEIATK